MCGIDCELIEAYKPSIKDTLRYLKILPKAVNYFRYSSAKSSIIRLLWYPLETVNQGQLRCWYPLDTPILVYLHFVYPRSALILRTDWFEALALALNLTFQKTTKPTVV